MVMAAGFEAILSPKQTDLVMPFFRGTAYCPRAPHWAPRGREGERELLVTKALRHITIAAAVMVGAFSPVKAADDGDCCTNLEDRIAKLEDKADKSHEKVSVTVSGWITKSVDWWSSGSGQPSKLPQQR